MRATEEEWKSVLAFANRISYRLSSDQFTRQRLSEFLRTKAINLLSKDHPEGRKVAPFCIFSIRKYALSVHHTQYWRKDEEKTYDPRWDDERNQRLFRSAFPMVEDDIITRLENRTVNKAMEYLTWQSYRLLQMHYIQGMSYDEMGMRLQRNPVTLRSSVRHARENLRKLLTISALGS